MLALYGFVGSSASAPSAPDPNIDMTIHSPQLGLVETAADGPIPGSFTQVTERRVQFLEGRTLEDYAFLEERNEQTNSTSYHFLDRGKYGVQRGSELVTSADNGTGGIAIPFIVDYTGDATPDGDLPVFLSPPGDLFFIAEDQATVGGLSGVGWLPVLLEELASHDEVVDVTFKIVSKSRFLFVDVAKFKGANPEATELTIDFHAVFVGGMAEQSYGLIGLCGAYLKKVQDGLNIDTDFQPVPVDKVWPVVSGQDPFEAGPGDFPNGAPAYDPPNSGNDPYYPRFPLDEPGWFDLNFAGTGESTKPPARIRFHISMADFQVTSEVILDFEEP